MNTKLILRINFQYLIQTMPQMTLGIYLERFPHGFSINSTITGSSSASTIASEIKEKVNGHSQLTASVNGEIIKVNYGNYLRIAFDKVTQNRQWFDDNPVGTDSAALDSATSDNRTRWTEVTVEVAGNVRAGQTFNFNIDGIEANYTVDPNAQPEERTLDRVVLGLKNEAISNGIKPVQLLLKAIIKLK